MTSSPAFEALRPLCVVLMKEQRLDQVLAVDQVVQDLDPDSLRPLQQYVLFPLRILLKNQSQLASDICEAGVICMCHVLEKTSIGNWDMFSDLFSALCITISSKTSCGQVSTASEELKLAVVKTLAAMVKSADTEILLRLWSPKSLPMVGHAVSLLLSLAEYEKMRELQYAALNCLSNFVPDDVDADSALYRAASCSFASFLPGLTVAVSRVITADQKQGQIVTVNAIQCWSKHVAMVMDDRLRPPVPDLPLTVAAYNKANRSKPSLETKPNKQVIPDEERSLAIQKTDEWVKDTASKLDILVAMVVTMVTSRSWKVRLALVRLAELLITRCKKSMSGSLNHLLELLVNTAQDEYDQVSHRSQAVLGSLAKEPLTAESTMLRELLEENMHKLVTALPRLIKTADDEKKLSMVTTMMGYVRLLGPRLNCLLNSEAHLKRLSIALLQALELDTRDMSVLETGSTLTDSGSDTISGDVDVGLHNRHLRNFKHFSNHKIYDALTTLCQLLGQYGNVPLLIDNFLTYFHESSTYVKQATMIMNEIMQGTLLTAGGKQPSLAIWEEEDDEDESITSLDELKSQVRMLLDEFLSPTYWDLPTTILQPPSSSSSSSPASSPRLPWQPEDHLHVMRTETSSSSSSSSSSWSKLSVSVMNHNTLLKCLMLDGIAVFAEVLGPHFSALLMHCLYSVLERMADERTVICQHALATLSVIGHSCGHRSVAELLYANADYLTDSVSARLRHFDWHPKAPLVLKVTLQHSSADILPLLQDTVDEVLRLLDGYHGDHAAPLMSVLQSLVTAINGWFPPNTNTKVEEEQVESTKLSPVEDIAQFCLDYIKAQEAPARGLDDQLDADQDGDATENDHCNSDQYMDEPDKPKELPLHVSNVKKVLVRCVHMLSSSNPRLRLLVLSTVQAAAEALRESQDVLLPLVHKLWPAFIKRFTDQETLVTCKAFEVLQTLADTAKDFIRRRTCQDVLPKLVGFLQTQAPVSAKAGPSYHHTALYKLQLSVLTGVGHLCLQVEIVEMELLNVVQACLPYLNTNQPQSLQQACVSSFECFIQADPDAVWFSLQDVYCPTPIQPPHSCFPPCKFAGETAAQKEQWINIGKLLT